MSLFRRRKRITVYTTPGCPDCAAVKGWLERRDVSYAEKDLSDPKIMAEAKERFGVRVAPITVVGDRFFYGTFADQQPELEAAVKAGQ